MNKILRFSFMALLAVLGFSNAMADDVTIDFDNDYATLFPGMGQSSGTGTTYVAAGEFNETTTSAAVQGVTVTVSASAADAGTRNRMWASSPRLRMYDGTIVIKASQNFKKLVMNIKTNNGLVAKNNTVNTGTLNFDELTSATGKIIWEGDANEVTMTIAGNTQFKSIVVSFDGSGSGGDTPGPGPSVTTTGQGTLASPYTAADALAVAGTLEQGKSTSDSYYIKGKVSSITYPFDVQHGTATFNISDDGQPANEFLCYGVKFLENKAWLNGNTQIATGDEVVVYGPLKNHNGTLETGSGAYLYSLNGVTQNTGGQEEAATPVASIADMLNVTSPSSNLELTLSNAKVLFNDGNYIYMRENGKALCFYKFNDLKETAKNNAIVSGKVNVDFEVYRKLPEVKTNAKTDVSGLSISESEEEAEPVQTTLDAVAAGTYVCDLVQVTATLKKEVNGTNTTYKLASGSTEIVVVNNSKGLDKIEEGTEITAIGIVNTNNDLYQMKLTKKVSDPSGISSITADQMKNAPVYNLKGQRVNAGYKGLVIKGNTKFIAR